MRILTYILFGLLLVSCTSKQKNEEIKTVVEKDEEIIVDTTIQHNNDKSDFLELIKYVDSVGYIYDTSLFKTTYNQFYSERNEFEGYYLYSYSFEKTTLFQEYSRQLEWFNNKKDQTSEKFYFNLTPLKKVSKITLYHYINKEGNGHFCDGVIELWSFPETDDAKNAAEEISLHESRLFTNRGAYVCYKNNDMYLFYSRSAGFYTPLKQFIDYFENSDSVFIPNRSVQRKYY